MAYNGQNLNALSDSQVRASYIVRAKRWRLGEFGIPQGGENGVGTGQTSQGSLGWT